MRTILAFLMVITLAFPAQAIMDEGDILLIQKFCTKDAIFSLSREDKISEERGEAMYRHLMEDGSCTVLPFQFHVALKNLAEVYTAHNGVIVEVWSVEGTGDKHILVIDPRQNNSFKSLDI